MRLPALARAPSTFGTSDTSASQVRLQGSVQWDEVHVKNTIAGSDSEEMTIKFQLSIGVRPIDWIQIVACGFTCDSGSLKVRSTVRLTHNTSVETDVECNMCVSRFMSVRLIRWVVQRG